MQIEFTSVAPLPMPIERRPSRTIRTGAPGLRPGTNPLLEALNNCVGDALIDIRSHDVALSFFGLQLLLQPELATRQ
jgi:hypothetical protein